MNNLNKLYDKKYTDKINSKSWRFKQIPIAVEIIRNFFDKPDTVLDIGCANGLHCKAFKELGSYVAGIEGTNHFESYLSDRCDEYHIIDIRKEFSLGKKFDLVHCVEVLEHIEGKWDNMAIENICNHGDVLCITANPSTGGHSHVNCHHKPYWIKKFESKGFTFMRDETESLQNIFKRCDDDDLIPNWYQNLLMIFRKNK